MLTTLKEVLGPAKAKRTGAKQLKAARKALSTY